MNAMKKSKKSQEISASLNMLRDVAFDQGFHFYTSLKHYTGITAVSLPEFVEKLKIIDSQSVSFHFQRSDFQKWMKETIGDAKLSEQIDQINSNLTEESLRKAILELAQKRILELQKISGRYFV
jgi:hypothetical protein